MKWKIGIIFSIVAMLLCLTMSCSTQIQSNDISENSDPNSSETEVSQEQDNKEYSGDSGDNEEVNVDNISITWEEAKEYDGKIVTVTGPVVKYFYSEGWGFTSLTIGKKNSGGVSVVIFDKDSEGFPEDMESYYVGKEVAVTGEISYRETSDACQIDINNPEQISVISESDIDLSNDLDESGESNLIFSYTDKLPEYWGIIRIVEPLLATFKNIEVKEDGDVITVSGQLEGNPSLKECFNPEMGIFTAISALIIDKEGNIKWEQDGYLQGTGSYIKKGETKEFMFINQSTAAIETEDTLIIISYTEGGMIEDDITDADKGVFGIFEATK